MLALYRSDRQADALGACRALRRRLDEELGLAPGEALADLETAILRQDPALAVPSEMPPAEGDATPPRQAVRDGGRRVVLVSGEAGVGKTRLVAELASLVADEAAVVVGHCDQTALIPYQPVTEALRGSPEATDALARAPEPLASRLTRLIDHPGGPALPASARPDDTDTQQTAFLDAVAGCSRGWRRRRPCCS